MDDLVIMANTPAELTDRVVAWKEGLETKGLRVNMAKTKILCSKNDPVRTKTSST